MKRCPPLWLLRDITAAAAMMAALWALTWQMFFAAYIAEKRRQPISSRTRATVYSLLAKAEEALDYVLTRQAHRLLGLSTHAIERTLYHPPVDRDDFSQRARHFHHCLENIDAVARALADELRRRLNITKAEAEAVRTHGTRRPLSPRDWGSWIGASSRRDGGGLTSRTNASARGPPARLAMFETRNLTASEAQLLRAPSHAWPARPIRP